jgi:CTP:phosphocholine cytidylyltransferase-like protein
MIKKIKVEPEYAVNEETGKKYELKPDKYKEYPHLEKLKEEIKSTIYGSTEYWRLRCIYLEKAIDNTYSCFERDNCREFYMMLVNKQH